MFSKKTWEEDRKRNAAETSEDSEKLNQLQRQLDRKREEVGKAEGGFVHIGGCASGFQKSLKRLEEEASKREDLKAKDESYEEDPIILTPTQLELAHMIRVKLGLRLRPPHLPTLLWFLHNMQAHLIIQAVMRTQDAINRSKLPGNYTIDTFKFFTQTCSGLLRDSKDSTHDRFYNPDPK